VVAARQYVYDASRLRIGVSGGHEFDRIRDQYSRFAETNPNCTDEECIAKFKFDNGWLKNIYLVHSAFLYSVLSPPRFDYKPRDRLGLLGKQRGEFEAHSWESIAGPAFAVPFEVDHNMSSGKVAYLSFNLTPAASTQQRARGYAFNESFLGRFSACKDATDMHYYNLRGYFTTGELVSAGFSSSPWILPSSSA
jgi:hypothetical protein